MIATVTQPVRERMSEAEGHRFRLQVREAINAVGLARVSFVSAGDGVDAVAWTSPTPVPQNTAVTATAYIQGRDFTVDEYPRFIVDATFRRVTGLAGVVASTDVVARAPVGVTAAFTANADNEIELVLNDGAAAAFEWDIQVELR